MAIPLNHYVYSSMNGYKTLYSSPSIPKDLTAGLENLAVQIYRLAHKREVFACFRPDDHNVCLVRAFQNGTDHAGRIRRCVHAVVFSLGDAAGSWFFSPLQVPYNVFLSPEASLQTLQNELQYEYSIKPFVPAPPTAKLSPECLLWLLEGMAGDDKVVVLDERGDALDTVRSLAWTLPPGVRKAMTVSVGAPMPDVPELGGIRLTILPAAARSGPSPGGPDDAARDEALLDAADAVIKFPSGNALKATSPNPYADFVASNIHSEVGFDRVRKLAALLERYPPSLEWTEDRFEQLLDAFDKIGPDIEEFGTVDVHRDPSGSLAVVKEFAAAGMHRLSLDILMAVSSVAMSQHGFDGGSFQEMVGRVRAGEIDDVEKIVEVVSYLAETLKKLLTAAGEAQ